MRDFRTHEIASAKPHSLGTLLWKGLQMKPAEPSSPTEHEEALCLDPRTPLPIVPIEAMVRQAEVDAAYLAVEAARADAVYQAKLQAKALEARAWAHRLRAAMARPMPYDEVTDPDRGSQKTTQFYA